MFRRILLYAFGVAMGVLVLKVTVFKDKDEAFTEWLPSNRLKRDMMEWPKVVRPLADCQLSCLSVAHSEIDRSLAKGEVLFDESGTRETPRRYVFEHTTLTSKVLKLQYLIQGDTLVVLDQILAPDMPDCICQ